MTLATVRAGLAARLDTISGLRVYATPPDSVQELPAAIVAFRGTLATYDHVMGAADVRYRFDVLVLVGSADEGQAQEDLEPYLSPTGASSVKAAVDGNLGGNADWASAGQGTPVARLTYPEKQGSQFWGTTFLVDAYETG